MVVCIKHKYISQFLEILVTTFKEYNLIFNAKKSAIINIKNHQAKFEEKLIYNMPYSGEYKFLGIWIDYKGSIESHLKKIK